MPRQNRMTPKGEIVAAPWRGRLMGNRGCLHDANEQLGIRRWRHQAWVCCRTAFRGRVRHPMPPNRWTALFFWDEAAALAAGHRPCGQCRYHDYHRFMDAWRAGGLPGDGPKGVDRHLHRHRVTRQREQVRFDADPRSLPDGTFLQVAEAEHLSFMLWHGQLWNWSPRDGGYLAAGPPPDMATVLTPHPMVEVLLAGYRPEVSLDA